MSLESSRLSTPSDILITAMEGCDDIQTVAVLAVLKDGDFIILTTADPITLVGMTKVTEKITMSQFSEEGD